jgi:hypothetical protein
VRLWLAGAACKTGTVQQCVNTVGKGD